MTAANSILSVQFLEHLPPPPSFSFPPSPTLKNFIIFVELGDRDCSSVRQSKSIVAMQHQQQHRQFLLSQLFKWALQPRDATPSAVGKWGLLEEFDHLFIVGYFVPKITFPNFPVSIS